MKKIIINHSSAMAVIAMSLALGAETALARGVPTALLDVVQDYDYENPCEHVPGTTNGGYGGEFGLGFRGFSFGASACGAAPHNPCPPGQGGRVGNTLGQCTYQPVCVEVCAFIDIMGHIHRICTQSCS